MSEIFFARDGSGATRADQGRYVPVDRIAKLFGKYKMQYFQDPPPPIGTTTKLSDFSEYRHVVIAIDSDDVCEKFPSEGYYFVHDLSRKECEALLNTDEPKE